MAAAPWVQLAKPGLTRLVLATTLFGGLVAEGSASPFAWLATLVGTALVVAGANALNMVAERETDALMERTARRPLPSGRLEPGAASWAAYGAATLGLLLLVGVNLQAALLALLAFASYVYVYTPLKRITPHALYVGTVPGAIPPVIGYAAVTGGQLDASAVALFCLLAVWQVPHFLAISIFRREEYARAGIQVFSVRWSQPALRWLLLGWSIALLAVSVLPVAVGVASLGYLAVAVGFGLPFVAGAAYGLRRDADRAWARSLFFATMPHLVVLLVGLAYFCSPAAS